MKLEMISPIFAVHHLSEAVDFYRVALGFDVAWSWGAPPDIAAVCRDDVEITLVSRPDARPPGASRAYLRITDVDAYYHQIVSAGANVVVPIADRVYGMRDFRVADPFGNQLDIGQAMTGGREA